MIKRIIKDLKEIELDYNRKAGSLKMGISSHYWRGKADGVHDIIKLLETLIGDTNDTTRST